MCRRIHMKKSKGVTENIKVRCRHLWISFGNQCYISVLVHRNLDSPREGTGISEAIQLWKLVETNNRLSTRSQESPSCPKHVVAPIPGRPPNRKLAAPTTDVAVATPSHPKGTLRRVIQHEDPISDQDISMCRHQIRKKLCKGLKAIRTLDLAMFRVHLRDKAYEDQNACPLCEYPLSRTLLRC